MHRCVIPVKLPSAVKHANNPTVRIASPLSLALAALVDAIVKLRHHGRWLEMPARFNGEPDPVEREQYHCRAERAA